MAKLSKTSGRDNKKRPPIAKENAIMTDKIKIDILTVLVIFLEDTFATYFNNK